MANADGSSVVIESRSIASQLKVGSPLGMPPYALPIVATSPGMRRLTNVGTSSAMSKRGKRNGSFGTSQSVKKPIPAMTIGHTDASGNA